MNKLDKEEITNALALLEELVVNGNISPEVLYSWFDSEIGLIEQTIFDLKEILGVK
jgi:hypothetical protein